MTKFLPHSSSSIKLSNNSMHINCARCSNVFISKKANDYKNEWTVSKFVVESLLTQVFSYTALNGPTHKFLNSSENRSQNFFPLLYIDLNSIYLSCAVYFCYFSSVFSVTFPFVCCTFASSYAIVKPKKEK